MIRPPTTARPEWRQNVGLGMMGNGGGCSCLTAGRSSASFSESLDLVLPTTMTKPELRGDSLAQWQLHSLAVMPCVIFVLVAELGSQCC